MASANNFNMKNLKNPAFSYSDFPFIYSDKYPQSAANINIFLQYSFFNRPLKEKDFSNKSLSPFRNTESHSRIYEFYEPGIKENKNYIEVSISGDGCGAYCEGFSNTFVFDAYSGQLITLIDLLSPNGIMQLENKIRSVNLKRIEPYIQDIPKEDDPEEVSEEYSMYKYCYDNMKDDKEYYNKVDEGTSFSLSNDMLTIVHERCSNHALRALDEIGDFVSKFSFKELQPYLSAEGKKYLSNQKYKLSSIKTHYKVFHGKIDNKYPITILHSHNGRWVYWYDRYNLPIELHKSHGVTKDNLFFKEAYYDDANNDWEYTAEWQIKKINKMFTGTFTRISDGKKMKVTFK